MIDFGNKLLSPISTTVGAYVTLGDKIENENSDPKLETNATLVK